MTQNEMLHFIISEILKQRESLVSEVRFMEYSDDYFEEKLEALTEAQEAIDYEIKDYFERLSFQCSNVIDCRKSVITGVSPPSEVKEKLEKNEL